MAREIRRPLPVIGTAAQSATATRLPIVVAAITGNVAKVTRTDSRQLAADWRHRIHVNRSGVAFRCHQRSGSIRIGTANRPARPTSACSASACRSRWRPQLPRLAGSLTYYFNSQGQVEHISFLGRTGDSTQLVGLLTRTYQFQSLPSPTGEQLYQVHYGGCAKRAAHPSGTDFAVELAEPKYRRRTGVSAARFEARVATPSNRI